MQYVKYTKWINIAKQITKVHVNIVFWGKNKIITTTTKQNKRAQRALGRSPEEKVKIHSWAIYRVPLMVLYTKYESSGPCSFRQEDFWKLHFKNIFFTPWPTYATNQNHLNNFGRGLPRDHSYWVWSNSH